MNLGISSIIYDVSSEIFYKILLKYLAAIEKYLHLCVNKLKMLYTQLHIETVNLFGRRSDTGHAGLIAKN